MAIEFLKSTKGVPTGRPKRESQMSLSLVVRSDREKVSLFFKIPAYAANHLGIKPNTKTRGEIWVDREANKLGFVVCDQGSLQFSPRSCDSRLCRLGKTIEKDVADWIRGCKWHPNGFTTVDGLEGFSFFAGEGTTELTFAKGPKKK